MGMIRFSLILLAIVVRLALADLTYTVTATKNGKTIQDAEITLDRIEPSLHNLNTTSAGQRRARDRDDMLKRVPNSIYYSSNWCGAVQHSVSTNKITSVHGYFQVPTLSARPGVTTFPQYVASWIGIDGSSWGSALLQSGITSQISSTGVQTNWAWLEWFPDAAYNIPSFPVATGDWIELTISAPSSTTGTIVISNLDQAVSYTIPLNNGTPLGRVDAEWIVEVPATSGGAVPMARFSDIWFEDCTVTTANTTVKNIDAATMYFLSGNKCTSTQYDSTDFWASSS